MQPRNKRMVKKQFVISNDQHLKLDEVIYKLNQAGEDLDRSSFLRLILKEKLGVN